MPGHLRLVARRAGVLRVVGHATSDRGGVGGCRKRRRRSALAVGRRAARPDPLRVLRRDRRSVAGGSPPAGGIACRCARPGRERLGVGVECLPALPLRRVRWARAARTTASRAWYAAGRTSTAPTECAARSAGRCSLPPGTPTSASASSATRPSPRLPFDWVDVPAGEAVLGRDPVPYLGEALADETTSTRGRRPLVRAVADAGDERAVPALRVDGCCARAGALARRHAAARSGASPCHLGRLVRRQSILLVGRRPPAERGRVGEGCPWHRRAPLPLGRRSTIPRAVRWSAPASSTARRRRSERALRAQARTGCSRCRGTSGSGSRARTGRTRTTPPTAAKTPATARSVSCAAVRSPAPGSQWARCASRSRSHAVRRQCHIGFRVARECAS